MPIFATQVEVASAVVISQGKVIPALVSAQEAGLRASKKPLYTPPTDEGARNSKKRLMDMSKVFITNAKFGKSGKPSERKFNDQTPSAESLV
jgi:hypothetical protein